MFVNFQLKKMAMIILLFLIEVGAEVGIKVAIITSGICYFGIMEIRKVYRSESLVKERADRRNLSVLQNLKFLVQDTNIINTRTNQQIKLIEASILTVAEACDQFRNGLFSDIIRCKASKKKKEKL